MRSHPIDFFFKEALYFGIYVLNGKGVSNWIWSHEYLVFLPDQSNKTFLFRFQAIFFLFLLLFLSFGR